MASPSPGKSTRGHLEAVNHRNAILLLEDLVQQNEPLTEWTIKCPYQLILRGIDDDNAGCYRAVNVRIAGAVNVRSSADLLIWQMICIAREAFQPCIQARGLPWEEDNSRNDRTAARNICHLSSLSG